MSKEENIENKDGSLKTPKNRIEKTRAAIEAILSTTKKPEESQKNNIKPFIIENPSQTYNTPKNPDSIPIEAIAAKEKSKIPALDLNRKLNADQRKLSATTRKGPAQKAEIEEQAPKLPPVQNSAQQKPTKRQMPAICPQHILIREIVARDIEKMYRKASLQSQ